MKYRIQYGAKTWQGTAIPSRIPERPEIRNYHLRTDLHVVDGFCDEQDVLAVPAGYVLVDEHWSIINGVAVQHGNFRLISDIEAEQAAAAEAAAAASYAALMDQMAPRFEAHPDPADVVPGGMWYRVPDPERISILTMWFVRDDDLIAQQISAHDKDGDPINRSVNLRTRVCTTHLWVEVVAGLSASAKNKAKTETSVGPAKPKKGLAN